MCVHVGVKVSSKPTPNDVELWNFSFCVWWVLGYVSQEIHKGQGLLQSMSHYTQEDSKAASTKYWVNGLNISVFSFFKKIILQKILKFCLRFVIMVFCVLIEEENDCQWF